MTNDLERKWRRLLSKQEQLKKELDALKREAATLERRLAAVCDKLQWLEYRGPGDDKP